MDTNVTNDNLNEDWIKTMSWDLPFTNLAGLFDYLGVADAPSSSRQLGQFMALPAWGVAPDQLKREADEWVASHSA
jgi:hypothetical protein